MSKRFSDRIIDYKGPNPFCDSQARNFSDIKVSKEFYPISSFWSLFNDQHEVLLGTRGCGKTFLLKMMRYSMLKKIMEPQAEKLVSSKEYIGVYVPMHLEFVAQFNNNDLSEDLQIILYQIAFNCLLAEALLVELESLLEEEKDDIKRVRKMASLVRNLDEIWFNVDKSEIYELGVLRKKISKVFYNIDWKSPVLESIPNIFKRQICSILASVKTEIAQVMDWREEPTWIVCIDEAEFLSTISQKCINTLFRSDTNRIALKIATLPYFHKTLETLDKNISVVNGNDFSYRVVDMDYNSSDFISLTNALCEHRLKMRFDSDFNCSTLEDFLGTIGKDDQIDYYRNEVGEEKATREYIENSIINEFPERRKKNAGGYANRRKTVYDKYAPIYFVRQMYALSQVGNNKPGWYAGAQIIRKISQGNPRLFIQLMNELFEKARKSKLEAKRQSEVVLRFSKNFCKSTKALEGQGPIIDQELEKIAKHLQYKTHEEELKSIGCAFVLKYKNDEELEKCKEWLHLAIAYSRIIVTDEVKINDIIEDTKFLLANTYAAEYWLPMRADAPQKISIADDYKNSYYVKRNSEVEQDEEVYQLSLFEEVNEW